jgi:hypothetical protein
MSTSYDKIYELLLATDEGQALMAATKDKIRNVKLDKVKFRLSHDRPYNAVPQFVFSCRVTWDGGPRDLSASSFVDSDDAEKVVRDCFGSDKKVKTRNCSPHIVRDGGLVQTKVDGCRESRHQQSFYRWVVDQVEEEFETVIAEERKRLAGEVKALVKTEEFAQSRHEALVNFCKDTITKALLPWNHMSEQVLNDAWDQFICAAAMVE